MSEKPWWYPKLTDDKWLARLREDYPEKSDWSDEELANYFNQDGSKYETTWDHIGDAYGQFEPLADAYLKAQQRLEAVELLIIRAFTDGYMRGHNDTVESCFTDIVYSDRDTYFAEEMQDWIEQEKGDE